MFSVFDTGSTAVLLNPETVSLLQVNDPSVPDELDIRVWGLEAVDPVTLGAPLDTPEAEVEDKVPSQGTSDLVPNLLGGPLTNEILAYIDYTTDVSRTFYFGTLVCPDITFFEPGDSLIPMPLYWVDLEPFGGTDPGSDGGSRGQRYYMRGMRFKNGANTVESPTSPTPISTPNRFLYDTGNTTTQISEPLATALGIDLNTATNPPDDTITIGVELLNCYNIDKVEIDADDGDRNANIGSNFFETTQVVFDGPQSRLGLYFGQCIEAVPCDVSGDGAVDISDIQEIGAHRGTTNSDYDIDGDGKVTTNDIRKCVLECDNPRCAPVTP